MIEVLKYVYVFAAVVFLFGAAIFVHEFGHYWVARRRKMKVEAFAIGFGPKIACWTRDGIEYSWRWIPAGGFVKLPQMVTSEMLEGNASTSAESVPPASPWSKILVAFAGPFMNIVFAFFIATLIYYLGLPVPVNPPIVGHVDPNSAEYKLGIRDEDLILQVDGKPVKSWQDVQMTTILARTNVLPVVIERNGERKTYYLAATVNSQLEGKMDLKMLNLDPRDHPEVVQVSPSSAADKAGLKTKDIVLAFNQVPVASQEQLIEMIQQRAGKPSDIRVQRGPKKLSLMVTPILDPASNKVRIGVMLSNHSATIYQEQRPGPLPWDQIVHVWNQTVDTISALIHTKQTGVGAKDLSGPVGILSMLAIQVNTDYRLALNFLVLLNVNLAILNLLPLPVLDGGHILFSVIERIRRRPISARFMEYATTTFAILLISFMLYVTFFDVKRWSLFRTMFKQSSQIEQVEKAPAQSTPAPASSTP